MPRKGGVFLDGSTTWEVKLPLVNRRGKRIRRRVAEFVARSYAATLAAARRDVTAVAYWRSYWRSTYGYGDGWRISGRITATRR